MIGAMTALRNYPTISKWLRPWLDQIEQLGRPGDYRVIVSELEQMVGRTAGDEDDLTLKRLAASRRLPAPARTEFWLVA